MLWSPQATHGFVHQCSSPPKMPFVSTHQYFSRLRQVARSADAWRLASSSLRGCVCSGRELNQFVGNENQFVECPLLEAVNYNLPLATPQRKK